MNDLFINTEEQEKTAGKIPLSVDSTDWVKKIIMTFSEEFPTLQSLPMNIQWKEKDLNTGAAVGSLKVGDILRIPLIVEDYSLYPLDLMMLNGRTYPLTQETVQEYIQDPSVFQVVSNLEQQKNEKLFDSPLSLPIDTNNGNTLDKVSSFISRKDYNNLIEEATKPDNYAGFIANDTLDVLEKVSTITPTDEVDFGKALLNNIEMDRQLVGEDEFGNSFVKQANSKIDYTYTIPVTDADTLSDLIKTENSEKSQEKIAMNSYAIGEDTLCITENNDYYVFSKTAGVPVNSSNCIANSAWPSIGETGTIIVNNEATKPFEVTGLRKIGNYYEIDGWDGLASTTYYPLPKISRDSLVPHESEKNAFYIPGNAKYIKLNNPFEVSFEKTALFEKEVEPHFVGKDNAGLYYLQGREFSKYAQRHSIRDLSLFDAKWSSTHCGAYDTDIEKLSNLRVGEKYQFSAQLAAPADTNMLQSSLQTEYDNLTRDISTFPKNLVKEASKISDKDSVDALLSLGLVNRDNVMEFTTVIPEYEAAVAGLAKLLLTARLGLKLLDSEALSRGMHAIVKAIYQLKYLKQMLKK